MCSFLYTIINVFMILSDRKLVDLLLTLCISMGHMCHLQIILQLLQGFGHIQSNNQVALSEVFFFIGQDSSVTISADPD